MGNSRLREPPQPQNQPLTHLTADPRYQQLLRELYANNSPNVINDYPQFRNNLNYNPYRHNRANVEIKKATPIKNELFIKKDTLRLVTLESNQLGLAFSFYTQHDININIYLIAKEQLNPSNITTKIDAKQTQQFTFTATDRDFPQNSFQFDIKQFHKKNDLTFDKKNGIYPLVIKMSLTKTQENSSTMYLYATFIETNQQNFKIETKRIKIERNNKAYLANEIYGLSNGKNEAIEDKDCAICLCEKVDTMIIPCKHMCLCRGCCQDLRFRAQKCPICRTNIERFILVEKPQIIKQEEQKEEEIKNQEEIIKNKEPFQGKGVLIGSSEDK